MAREPLSEKVRAAAVNLRITGLSERTVYERFREILSKPPSYRDLRAVYKEAGVWARSDATTARHEGRWVGDHPVKETRYYEHRRDALEVDKTVDNREAFERRYVLGYLGREILPPRLTEEERRDYLIHGETPPQISPEDLDLLNDEMAERFEATNRGEGSP